MNGSPAGGYVVAADAGGTHTRVACFGLDGRLLALARGAGGNPRHQQEAAANVAETTRRALDDGGLDPRGAAVLVAGLAGINRVGSCQGDGDNSWADGFFLVPGMTCRRVILNDAVVAHRGAFCGAPGVVAVAGTGSMILAIDERGTETENGQFDHYAGAARHLARAAIRMILRGEHGPADAEFVSRLLAREGCSDVADLRRARAQGAGRERDARDGGLARLVTSAAETSPLADRAVRRLADEVARGVGLVAPYAGRPPVGVVAIGGVGTSPAFASRFAESLAAGGVASLRTAVLDPVGGAALLALERAGIDPEPALMARLRETNAP